MKKIFTLLLTVAASVGIMFAQKVQIGDLYYNLNGTSQTAEVAGNSSASGEIIIPASVTYNEVVYSVTSIGVGAFNGCTGLTSVTIPNSVTSIGEYAFWDCSSLTSIIVENGNSFYDSRNNCNAIIETATNTLIVGCKNTIIPNSVTNIGNHAFYGCSSLTSITIPNSVTSIGESAFFGCTGLTSITIPNSVTNFGWAPFSNCTSLPVIDHIRYADTYLVKAVDRDLSTYNIKEGTRYIGDDAFHKCTNLVSIKIPNSVTSIGECAFNYCKSLASIEIPDSVTYIGSSAFHESGITHPLYNAHIFAYMPTSYSGAYTIPEGIESIACDAFFNCSGLTSVIIGNSVTSIGESAFRNCSGLTSVTIPNSVTSIGERAFANCSHLPIENNIRYAGTYLVEAVNKTLSSYSIKSGTKWIGSYAFRDCSNLISITIPNSVTSIGGGAFSGCSGLTSIEIPNSVTSIGDYAFEDCRGLNTIKTMSFIPPTLGKNVFLQVNPNMQFYLPQGSETLYQQDKQWRQFTSIIPFRSSYKINELYYTLNAGNSKAEVTYENLSDTNYTSLNKVIIPPSVTLRDLSFDVTSISDSAFTNCASLNTISIPAGIKSIGANAFLGAGLTSVEWKIKSYPDFLSVEETPFYSSIDNIKSFTLGNEVENIPAYLCNGMVGLETITLPSSVTKIGKDAFLGAGLTSVEWKIKSYPDFLSVEETPFYSSIDNIKSFTLGNEVENIPAYLCNGMVGLEAISFSSSLTSIGDYAFANINSRKFNSIIFPHSVVSVGKGAFSNDIYIENIEFGDAMEFIGEDAFKGCSRVLTMTSWSEFTPNVATGALDDIKSAAELYVRSSCLRKYEIDDNWNRFLLKEIGATETTMDVNEVTVVPADNTALFAWPTNENAATYTITITKGGEVFCILVFNANGQLTGIAFAPGRNGARQAHAAIVSNGGMQFTVTGLDIATRYDFTLKTQDETANVLAEYTGSFGTTGAVEGLYDLQSDQVQSTKILHDGQIVILRGEKVYTVQGQEVK